MSTQIYVDRGVIFANRNRRALLHPTMRVSNGAKIMTAHGVKILGPSEVIYNQFHPVNDDANVWIETGAAVELLDREGLVFWTVSGERT